MEFYVYLRLGLAYVALVALVWPLNAAWLFLAHRIREGTPREDDETRMENDEVRTRALLGSAAVAGVTLAFFFLDVVLAEWLRFPPGIVHLIVFLGLVPTAAFALTYYLGYTDYFEGLSLLGIYVGLPLFGLAGLNALTGLLNPVLKLPLLFLRDVVANP